MKRRWGDLNFLSWPIKRREIEKTRENLKHWIEGKGTVENIYNKYTALEVLLLYHTLSHQEKQQIFNERYLPVILHASIWLGVIVFEGVWTTIVRLQYREGRISCTFVLHARIESFC